MRAVLINSADVRLGEKSVGDDCRLIRFGGCYFVKTDDEALLDGGGGLGIVFVETLCDVTTSLDVFNPTKNWSRRA